MNKISKLASAVGLILTVIFSTGLGCFEHDPKPQPPVTSTTTAEELIRAQTSSPTTGRELASWGINGDEYLFVHKIGVINDAFVGIVSPGTIYNGGPGKASITYSAGQAEIMSESYSIKNIERVTNQVSGNISGTFSIGKEFKLGAAWGFVTTQESVTETTIGTEFSTMINNASTNAFEIVPEMGEGRYALVGTANYWVYQTTRYNFKTYQIVARDVWFAQAYGDTEMDIRLVKDSGRGFNLDLMNDIEQGSLPTIQNITQDELEKVRIWADEMRTPVEHIFYNVGGEKHSQSPSSSTGWNSYQELDTISNMWGDVSKDANGNFMDINRYKTLGYTKVKLVLNCSFRKGYSDYTRIGMKIINKKIQNQQWDQFEESGEHKPSTTEIFKFDLSRISKEHAVYIEFRTKRTNPFADRDLYINGGRTYTWTFSN